MFVLMSNRQPQQMRTPHILRVNDCLCDV